MSAERIIAIVYTSVSVLSLAVYVPAAMRLRRAHAARVLIRTTMCRVVCAVLYVAVGINAVVWRWATGDVAIGVYTVTAAVWIVNTRIDRRLGAPRRHHRSRWPITVTFGRPNQPPSEEDHYVDG